jgi:hypothetical protein
MAATDSLVIAEVFELMGAAGGVQSDIPELVNSAGIGAKFQLLSPESSGQASGTSGSWDLGTPQPTVDIVQSLLLDGERPFGARSSNRTITLPIKITAPDQVTLIAARERLMQAVDQQTFTMTWTPAATGLALMFDCFRALPAVYSYGFLQNQPIPVSILTLTFQALPYGRTDPMNLSQVAFSSPILNGIAAPPNPVVMDNFSTVSGTNWSQTSSQFVVGPKAAHWTPPAQAYPWSTCTYTKSGLNLNATGLPVLSVWFGQSLDTAHWGHHPASVSNVTMRWNITDNGGHKLNFSRQMFKVPYSNVATTPKWTRYTVAIPQGNATFNYTNVTAYTVTISNWGGGGKTSFTRLHAWLDDIVFNPPSLATPASQRGVVYNIMGAAGTARTPISAQFQLPQSGTVSQELSGSGVWWPPVGVTSVMAECIGAGGSGGARTTTGFGGGGGGGEYAAEPALTVAAGTPVPFSCGTGGQSGASQQVITFTQPGTGSWVCPTGVTTVLAECIGGGGQGAAGGGGGGGGEYAAEPSLAVTAGKTYKFTVGHLGYNTQFGFGNAGNGSNSVFAGDSVTVTAHGGLMPKSGGTVAGVGGTGSSNTTHHNGGNGGTSPSYAGGGGGGSGGSALAGNTGSNGAGNTGGAGAAAVTGGGAGATGANNPGFPAIGFSPGGGGGGGYGAAGNNAGAGGGTGQIKLTYTVAAGSPVNGSSTTFGSSVSTGGVIVTANGGLSTPLNTVTGSAGGSGSTNTTHHSGGAGGTTGTSNGGGGGGSGGSAAAGNVGATGGTGGAGAAAVADGGKGANGSPTPGVAGDTASPPGGGGGGANSTGTTTPGGTGGGGNIVLTWTPPLAPFGTLVAHRPGAQSPPELNPCVPIGNTADSPVGIQYTVPSLVAGVNALFNGTYTVVLVDYNWDSPTASRAITVTVNQFEYVGGPAYPLSVTRTLTPATDIVNGICIMGELTLPVKSMDPSNTSGYFTVSIADTNINDQFLDVLFLDTQGSTVLVNIPPGNNYVNMFVDEPTPDRDIGLILGSDLDRSQAVSVLDASIISGSPFYIVPGDNLFLAYTVNGAPNLGVSYLNRWYLERLS